MAMLNNQMVIFNMFLIVYIKWIETAGSWIFFQTFVDGFLLKSSKNIHRYPMYDRRKSDVGIWNCPIWPQRLNQVDSLLPVCHPVFLGSKMSIYKFQQGPLPGPTFLRWWFQFLENLTGDLERMDMCPQPAARYVLVIQSPGLLVDSPRIG